MDDEQARENGVSFADHDEPQSPASQYAGGPLPEFVRLASPIAHVKADTVPFLILHGGDDAVVPTEQSVAIYEALKEAGTEQVDRYMSVKRTIRKVLFSLAA